MEITVNKGAIFYTLKLGEKFFFKGDKHIKIEVRDREYLALNLRTFRVTYFAPSEPELTRE